MIAVNTMSELTRGFVNSRNCASTFCCEWVAICWDISNINFADRAVANLSTASLKQNRRHSLVRYGHRKWNTKPYVSETERPSAINSASNIFVGILPDWIFNASNAMPPKKTVKRRPNNASSILHARLPALMVRASSIIDNYTFAQFGLTELPEARRQ